LSGALAIYLLLAAAAPPEPSLVETQEAAARAAGGTAGDDASREARARKAHWAPQLRAQGQLRDDQKVRDGVYRLAPLHEQDLGTGQAVSLMLSWDFSQVVYAREESQLALANAHLARLRREAGEKAAQLFVERRKALLLWQSSPPGPARAEACLAALSLTAQLDALTAGLFHDAVSLEEAACTQENAR
jgi:hypothetical protein